jgi:hypothetical protein
MFSRLSLKTSDYSDLPLVGRFKTRHFTSNVDGFGGLVVSTLATGTRVRGFKPGRNR